MHSVAFEPSAVEQFTPDFRRLFCLYRLIHRLRGRRIYGKPIYRLAEAYYRSLIKKHGSDRIDLSSKGFHCRLRMGDQRLLEATSEFFGLHPSSSDFGTIIHKYDTLIDVGANYGTFAVEALRQSANLDVFLFEPNPLLFDCLSYTFESNPFSEKSVFYPCAVGETTGKVKFFAANNSGLSGRNAEWALNDGEFKTVDIVRIDQQLNHLDQKIILLKIDVEGFELEAIRGCQGLLEKNLVDIVMEVNLEALQSRGETIESLTSLLKNFGYEEFKEFGQEKLLPLSGLEGRNHAYNVLIPATKTKDPK